MIEKGAMFSKCRKYRYVLTRIWNNRKDRACFICLNPSTADENHDDPTIRRCIRFAESWGYGGMYMVNLFAFRATNPKDMFKAKDPIGPYNNHYTKHSSGHSDITIMAWGNHGKYLNRDKQVLKLLDDPAYLVLTKTGCPGHPLYLRKTLKPIKHAFSGKAQEQE